MLPGGLGPPLAGFFLLEALVRRVRALATPRPVLAVVEDAHWADPTTRELLDLLVAQTPSMARLKQCANATH